jgi:predicted permease
MFVRIIRRLRHLLFGARSRHELDEEIAFHLEALTQDLVRQGMDPKEARREAHIRFGAPEWVHERTREERGLALFDETARNLRMAIRGLARNPMFAVTFITTLAMCIGLGAAVFSVVDATIWRPLPFPAPQQLAQAVLYSPAAGKNAGSTSADGRTWERIRDQADFLDRAVYSGWVQGVNLTTDQAAAFVRQQRVGTGYFRTLGIPPVMGREFTAAEDVPGGPAVALISHDIWSRTFGGDPDILGTSIRLKGDAFTVVGIMPEDFHSSFDADVWTPLRPSTSGEGGGTNYGILVRIPDGMDFGEADSRLAAIEPPVAAEDAPVRRFGLVGLDDALNSDVRMPMMILMGGILLMFAVGCANLAGLQIARSLARQSEMATRQALGSGTGALVRQTVVENVLLGVIGAGSGLALAYFALTGVEGLAQAHFGIWQPVRFDARVLSVALGTSALATLFFGLVPVLQVGKLRGHRALISGSRVMGGSSHVLRKTLMVGQMAVVTALLFGAGLLVRSYGYLDGLDPGFQPEGVLTVQFSLDDARYAESEDVERLFEQSLDGIRSIPGVTSAAVSLTLPYERPLNIPFRVGTDESTRVANAVYVTPGFFETLSIPLRQGRDFDERDRLGQPLALVVNQAFAETHLQDGPLLGARLTSRTLGADGGVVVGVVGNVQQQAGFSGGDRPVWETPTMYLAASQVPGQLFQGLHVWFSPHWVIRSATSAAELTPQVTRVFEQVAPDIPVARTATLPDVMDQAFAEQRFEAAFLIAVALFALLLAGIGLYGIVAHEVLERRTEMGLRMALGATPGDAVWTTGVAGIRLTVFGLVLGSVGAIGVSRVMQHLIYGIAPHDPVVMVALVGVLGVLAATATFVPATRLGRLDPATILRDN